MMNSDYMIELHVVLISLNLLCNVCFSFLCRNTKKRHKMLILHTSTIQQSEKHFFKKKKEMMHLI